MYSIAFEKDIKKNIQKLFILYFNHFTVNHLISKCSISLCFFVKKPSNYDKFLDNFVYSKTAEDFCDNNYSFIA